MTRRGSRLIADERIEAVRAVGNLECAAGQARASGRNDGRGGRRDGRARRAAAPARTGIGHTRWATHGRVSEENAHPHYDSGDRVHVVVNGIVENYVALKQRLLANGSVFTSETDAEVIAHLIAEHYAGDLADAVRAAYARAGGPLRVRRDEPRRARAARGSPQGVPAGRSAAATASSSWPRPCPRSWRRPGARSTSRTARSSRCAPTACTSRPPPASPWSAPSKRSTGIRRPPRRAATRRSC